MGTLVWLQPHASSKRKIGQKLIVYKKYPLKKNILEKKKYVRQYTAFFWTVISKTLFIVKVSGEVSFKT